MAKELGYELSFQMTYTYMLSQEMIGHSDSPFLEEEERQSLGMEAESPSGKKFNASKRVACSAEQIW
ncbi:hypothetical protein VTL71DRAFT_1693 [Oculimacula yallundae]|uniref:Uncharacterized protein n=1 Tax=Oculimacula yallundae TaxID=86028 RepID=A0ABR4CBE1_9HELO